MRLKREAGKEGMESYFRRVNLNCFQATNRRMWLWHQQRKDIDIVHITCIGSHRYSHRVHVHVPALKGLSEITEKIQPLIYGDRQ